jgi:hypothetical protein
MLICNAPIDRTHRRLLYVIWIVAAIGVSLATFVGCERCSGPAPLGRLVEKGGQVDRDLAARQGTWTAAEKGAEFEVGDAIRTSEKSNAHVALDDGSVLVVDEKTLIRFLEKPPGSQEQAFDLTMGSALVEADSDGTSIATSFGNARILGGGRVRLERKDNELVYRIMVGSARLEAEGGAPLDVQAGQAIVARLGSAVLHPVEPTPEAQLPAAAPAVEKPSGAIIAQVRGARVRGRAPGEDEFSAWKPGEQTVVPGSTVEVGAGSAVTVSQGSSRAELLAGGSYVLGADGQLVRASAGRFYISSETLLRLAVPGGFIETSAGRAEVKSLGAAGTEVLVDSGQARLVGKTTETLVAKERGRISRDGIVSEDGRGLSASDLDIVAGQSLVIHDPSPPVAVGFKFDSKCPDGIIQLSRKAKSLEGGEHAARGRGWVALSLAPGRHEYTLSCADGRPPAPAARGVVTVLADGGSKPVPSSAPFTTIDANGRSYTVLYQNQLPQVAVAWPGAPSAASYVLKRSSPGLSKSYPTAAPRYVFSSGALGEGTHTLFFEGGGRVSRLTTVNISFDNATPTASLQTPINAGGPPGSTLGLNGTALPGWAITVDGRAVNPDPEGRFSVTTQLPANGRPALLYLTHPTRGAHVYLRRSAAGR